jgi:hypothetical protein
VHLDQELRQPCSTSLRFASPAVAIASARLQLDAERMQVRHFSIPPPQSHRFLSSRLEGRPICFAERHAQKVKRLRQPLHLRQQRLLLDFFDHG